MAASMIPWPVLADDVPMNVPAEPAGGAGGGMGDFFWLMLPVLAVMLVMQFLMRRNEGSDKQRREQFLSTLKKNDPIVTIGGIKGTFVSLSEDKSEVTIKVEGDVRLRMEAAAIREIPVKPAS